MDEAIRQAQFPGGLEQRWQTRLVPVPLKEFEGVYAKRLLAAGRMDELRAHASYNADSRLVLARYCAEHGLVDELRKLADKDELPHLNGVLAEALGGRADAESVAAVMTIGLNARDDAVRAELLALLRDRDLLDRAVSVLAAVSSDLTYREWDLLARLRLAQGRVEEVRAMAREERATGADHVIAEIFDEHDMIDEVRALAERNIVRLSRRLVLTLARLGPVDEAVAVARARVDTGQAHAFGLLIDVLVEHRRADEAMAALAASVNRTVPPGEPKDWLCSAAYDVAHLLDVVGRQDDAIDVLRAYGDAPSELADLLAERGRLDEALQVLDDTIVEARSRRMGGTVQSCSAQLGELLIGAGRTAELRARANTGDPVLRERLARHLEEHELVDELRTRHAAGDEFASRSLALVLARQERDAELDALAEDSGDMIVHMTQNQLRNARYMEISYRLWERRRRGEEAS
ncbi:hypothetical protein [Streptomyces sasae]|uniref:hypothetical protein n=1 Tax=Streptomyces sasae TaxID=1266772 RepID=UPI0029316D17|nr:hypothetical protein [Streptomyces sasae]